MESATSPTPGTAAGRRSFLTGAIAALGTLFALSALYPAFRFLWPPREKEGAEGIVGIPLEDLLVGQSRTVALRGEPVLVIREEAKVVALSAVCTHQACAVRYEGDGVVLCPCHRATFDLNGNVTGGPAPQPLPSYRVRVDRNRIVVSR